MFLLRKFLVSTFVFAVLHVSGNAAKPKGPFAQCEDENYPAGSPQRKDLCRIRKYELGDDMTVFEKHTACLFKGLGYMTGDNNLDVEKIASDFTAAKKNPDAMKAAMEKCKTELKETEPGKVAVHYYKCLLNDAKVKDDFKEAFDYREVRSQNGQQGEYNKDAVRKQVADIDEQQCK